MNTQVHEHNTGNNTSKNTDWIIFMKMNLMYEKSYTAGTMRIEKTN